MDYCISKFYHKEYTQLRIRKSEIQSNLSIAVTQETDPKWPL